VITGEYVTTEERYGPNDVAGSIEEELDDEEYLDGLTMRSGVLIDNLEFSTTSGRVIRVGGEGGGQAVVKFENSKEENIVIGTFGGFGGHLHNFGLIYANLRDIEYYKRRPYILMREAIRRKKTVITLRDILDIQFMRPEISDPCLSFYKLCMKVGQPIFVHVITFIV